MVKVHKLAMIVFLLVVMSFFSSVVMADGEEKINTFIGNVTIGTNTSTKGAIVGVYTGAGAAPALTYTVGSIDSVGNQSYSLVVSCNSGTTAFLKVWGINATTQTCNNYLINTTNISASLVASAGACTYTQACDSNYKCCSGTTEINDGSTSGATCKSTCAAAAAAQTGGSGGGGGGGGGSGVALGSETSSAVSIVSGSSAAVSFAKADKIAVSEVTLFAAAAITNAKVAVAETTVGSDISDALAASQPDKTMKVYKYLSITTQNAKDADISSAKVKFEVLASWFTENKIDPATVKLNRYVGQQWVELPTTRVGLKDSVYVYEATTPGFSVFAVTAEPLPSKLTSFQLIDIIRDYYAGKSGYTPFGVIDLIRAFYGG